jgi:hypothetical protein
MHVNGEYYGDRMGYGVRKLTEKFLREKHKVYANGADVNNSSDINGYNEPVIKDRVMHMIEDGILWEQEKENNNKQ